MISFFVGGVQNVITRIERSRLGNSSPSHEIFPPTCFILLKIAESKDIVVCSYLYKFQKYPTTTFLVMIRNFSDIFSILISAPLIQIVITL